ncbi:MAG: S-layer homology domain-containing protein [Candidatus Gracilibacteria bacterium]|nr:S-layer homology domain-containing protein [Candidatus Gracilibacteria bacterium]
MIKKVLAILAIIPLSVNAMVQVNPEIEAANFLAEKGIIKDNSANPEKYNLDMDIRRGEMMKITINLTGVEPDSTCAGKFSDISKDDWICKYAETGLKLGIVAKNDKFRPLDNLTKTEAVKMVFKGLGIEKTFNTGNWQQDYMETAYQKGYILEKYIDYNANANRGFVFLIAKKALAKEGQKPVDFFKPISDEAE